MKGSPFHWFAAVALAAVLLVITVLVYQAMEGTVSFERAVPVVEEHSPSFALQPSPPSAPSSVPPAAEAPAGPIILPDRSGDYLGMLVDRLGEAQKRDPAGVERDLLHLARLDAPDARIYRWLGSIAHQRGEELAATAYFEHAVRLAPGDAADLFNLATLYLLQERYPEAIRSFDRVIRLQPPFLDDTYAYLGYCLDQMGATAEARHAWQLALELDPNNAVARRYLGGPVGASPRPSLQPDRPATTAPAQ